jgi:hypothetical protein
MDPIDMLQEQLDEYKRALLKSKNSSEKGQITHELYLEHKENLMPKIQKFVHAINTLKIYG